MPVVLRSKTFARRFMQDLAVKLADPERYRPWKSGITRLDEITGGIGKAWYIVVVAQLKGGKTGWLTTINKALAIQKVSYLNIHLEMNFEQMAWRVFAGMSGVSMTSFRDLVVTPEEWSRLEEAQKEIEEWNGYYSESAESLSEIKKLVYTLEPEVIVLDYLGLTKSDNEYASLNMQLGEISRSLKMMTKMVKTSEIEDRRHEMLLTLEGARSYMEPDDFELILDGLRMKWAEEDDKYSDQNNLSRGRTVITAQQTSKEMVRAGLSGKTLDSTAPKDSNKPFEDCDLGITINPVLGPDDKPVSNAREINIAVSRVSDVGKFTVGYNGATATFFDQADITKRSTLDWVR
jgi:hypothetical protein